MIIRYLEESFVNQTARASLINLIRSALPRVKLKAMKSSDYTNNDAIIIAEEYLVDSIHVIEKYDNIFLLVTECFVQNNYTGRITRNLSSINIVGLLAHITAFYLHLVINFRIIGKLSKWDILLLPAIPPFFLIYLYARLRSKRTNIRSLVEHEFMLAGLQYNFNKILITASGLIFSHPSISESFKKFYPELEKFVITPYPVFEESFQFDITGNQLSLLNWYGYQNQWRESRAKEVSNQIRVSLGPDGAKIRVEYNFTSKESPEMFHLIMRQSENWPLSSSTKIRDILIAGKIPVLEYDFCDHPVCSLALTLSDLISFYSSIGEEQIAIEKLVEKFKEKILLYNSWAIFENERLEANLIEFMEPQFHSV
jgi:hypothetical protein